MSIEKLSITAWQSMMIAMQLKDEHTKIGPKTFFLISLPFDVLRLECEQRMHPIQYT